jgi:hypothetical protein
VVAKVRGLVRKLICQIAVNEEVLNLHGESRVEIFVKATAKRFRFGVRLVCRWKFFMVVVLRVVDGLHVFSYNFLFLGLMIMYFILLND